MQYFPGPGKEGAGLMGFIADGDYRIENNIPEVLDVL
jgi:hypothetical protein